MKTTIFSPRLWPAVWRLAGGVAVASVVSSSLWGAWKQMDEGNSGRLSAIDARKDSPLTPGMSKKDKCLFLAS